MCLGAPAGAFAIRPSLGAVPGLRELLSHAQNRMRILSAMAVNLTTECARCRTSIWTMRSTIWLGILIGSTLGGLIPSLWGDGIFTYSSVLLSGVDAFVGLWVGFKISV
jgi:hypothetical protein